MFVRLGLALILSLSLALLLAWGWDSSDQNTPDDTQRVSAATDSPTAATHNN